MEDGLGLTEYHRNTVANYMRFAKYQRAQNLKTIESSFENIKLSRLLEETFTADEVKELLDELCSVIVGDLETELINTTHTVVLLLRQMCSQAERWHLQLQADISELENSELLEKVNRFEKEQLTNFEKGSQGSPLKLCRLEPLSDEAGPVKLLQMEIERLKEENQKFVARFKEMENQTLEILEEKSRLAEKLVEARSTIQEYQDKEVDMDDIEQNLGYLESEMSKARIDYQTCKDKKEDLQSWNEQDNMQKQRDQLNLHETTQMKLSLEKDLDDTKQHLLEIQSQLQLAENELDKKFSQTVAYANMKQMLANKNEQIKVLRRKLSEYENVE